MMGKKVWKLEALPVFESFFYWLIAVFQAGQIPISKIR